MPIGAVVPGRAWSRASAVSDGTTACCDAAAPVGHVLFEDAAIQIRIGQCIRSRSF
jgi:hypothetical protein